MKKFFIFSCLILFTIKGESQIATVLGCDTLRISCSNINYQTNLIIQGSWISGEELARKCEIYNCQSPPTFAQPRHVLEKETSPENWTAVAGPIVGCPFIFPNLAPGKYRVRSQVPTLYTDNYCTEGVKVYSCVDGKFQGYRGHFLHTTPWTYSNEVYIGGVQQSDIQWSYIDGDGNDLGDNLFDFNEVVRINTAGTQNYTQWWLAIFELNGAQRSKSTGWNFGAMPTEIDLSNFWSTWNFENRTSYRVQLAIANQCNTQWVEMNPSPPDFFICPQGSGCRPGDEIVPITLAPNPASYQFNLQNLPNSNVQVHLYDMSGRLVKNYQNSYDGNFDISDVNNGIYIIKAEEDGEILYNGKLSIIH